MTADERSLQRWLTLVGSQVVRLPAGPLLNANRLADLARFNRGEVL